MAEAFMRRAIEARPPLHGTRVSSMGVRALVGHAATEETIDVLQMEHQLDITAHRARQLRPDVTADLILTLDRLTTRIAQRLALPVEVAMLGDYAGTGDEVDDPYGRDRECYRDCAGHVAALIERVADRLEESRS